MKITQNRGYVQDVLYSGFAGAKNRLCQMGKMATSGGSECLEHILERVFQPSAESKFLSLDGISVPSVNQTLSLWEAR